MKNLLPIFLIVSCNIINAGEDNSKPFRSLKIFDNEDDYQSYHYNDEDNSNNPSLFRIYDKGKDSQPYNDYYNNNDDKEDYLNTLKKSPNPPKKLYKNY